MKLQPGCLIGCPFAALGGIAVLVGIGIGAWSAGLWTSTPQTEGWLIASGFFAGGVVFVLIGFALAIKIGGCRPRLEETLETTPAPDQFPYGIDQRPMPEGNDLGILLPPKVGLYERVGISGSSDSDYASYRAGYAEVFMELGICRDAATAQMGLATAKAETTAEGDSTIEAWSYGTEPSFLKIGNPRLGPFLAWTRGRYYFSAHAKRGEADLNVFMSAFPY